MTFAIAKACLLVGAIVVFYAFAKFINIPFEDPLYLFPILILTAWIMWAVHDVLWVVMGTLLDYRYILNLSTKPWRAYKPFSKFIVISMLIVIAIIGWHFAWYFNQPKTEQT
eukprot:2457087-Prymnesium_polylepis.2